MNAFARAPRVDLNGSLRPLATARVSVFDRGLLFGDGVYETLRAYEGRVFRAREHLRRLRASARRLGFAIPVSDRELARRMRRVTAANRLGDARVRVVVTRGAGPPSLAESRGLRPTVLVYAVALEGPTRRELRDGVRGAVVTTIRNDRRALDPAIKSLNLLNNYLAMREARRRGAREALMLNARGDLAEAGSANVFFVRRGTLCTPRLESGVLAGITRRLVLDLARRLGVPVLERGFRPAALLRAQEAFVTSSTIEILPLASVDGRRFPASRPYTRALQAAYRVTVKDELGVS